MVCMDGQRALVPNESINQDFSILDGAVAPTWGDLDLPSVLEINRFNSNIYYINLALGNLETADTNYGNPNEFFYAPLAEDGDFRDAVDLKDMLALSYANWDCFMEDLVILVHAVPGSKIDVDSPLNTITIGGVSFDPTPDDYILDSDNSPIGFQIMLDMIGCDFCEDIVIQASVDGRVATTGQFPELDIALQCCPEPSGTPTGLPSVVPSSLPSATPTSAPTPLPTVSQAPTSAPSSAPTGKPSATPTMAPTASAQPSSFPSTSPSTPFPTLAPTIKPQLCFPFQHPRFFPYRVEVWSGETISRSDNNVCSPATDKMYGYDPYSYHPQKPLPAYPYGSL